MRIFCLCVLLSVSVSLSAQENEQAENQKSDTNAVEHVKNGSAVSYKLILEFGTSFGIERYYYKGENIEEMRTAFSGFALFPIIINNICFNDRYLLGIGGGLEYRNFVFPVELAGTCFLNFRYYFSNPKRTVTPMLNIAVGGRMAKEFDGFFADNPWHLSEETMYGVYCTLGAGLNLNAFRCKAEYYFGQGIIRMV